MVNQMEATIKVQITESDDAKHRYVLYKEWDNKKPSCTIITLFPGSAELVITDTTQVLITNHLYQLGYGAFYSVNLFSKIGIANRGQKAFTNATNKTNDEIILGCVEKSKTVIFAWGSLPEKNKVVRQRVEVLLSKLDTYLDKCYYLTEGEGDKYYHPLSAKIRHEWILKPVGNNKSDR
ncbi:Hypothetical protein Tpal_1082 [Trichococcus palustris]|uniref:DUF1643 domain-containing protein n=1 Tax=Trichococcus palustris TaxID=140314 RepID=A0A143YFX7_9LACT|nr:DUF1643 domain-containing protein [Trichococcus palustris]CZQ89024.1 Hypothetical protein Tpal_1082 [Trichococcus palustris]SFL00254.1 hypothetical protein SAMN04488076_11313 [Trichococcus palustris]